MIRRFFSLFFLISYLPVRIVRELRLPVSHKKYISAVPTFERIFITHAEANESGLTEDRYYGKKFKNNELVLKLQRRAFNVTVQANEIVIYLRGLSFGSFFF